MYFRIIALWFIAMTVALSNSIVAWNFPLAGYRQSGPKRKLDQPPETSAFFKQADVLYDITPGDPSVAAHPETKLDWLIWNETSGMMVGKGSWQALYHLADTVRTGELLSSAKVDFAVFEFSEGEQVAADAVPACSFSAVARNGKPFVLKQTSGPWRIEVEANPYINEWEVDEGIRFSTRVVLSLSKGEEILKIETAVRSHSNGSVQLGRSVQNGHGIEVRASFRQLRPDGRILKTEIFKEENGQAIPFNRALVAQTKIPGGWFKSIRMSPGLVDSLSSDKAADDTADPFANNFPPGFYPKPRFHFPLLNFPDETIEWVGRPLWDLNEFLLDPKLKHGEKIGYDPLRDQLCIFTENEDLFEILDMTFMGCDRDSQNLAVAVTGQGELSVTVISCGKGKISLTNTKGEVLHSLETDAILGEEQRIIEANLEMRHGKPQDFFTTTAIVWDGEKIPIWSAKTEGAEVSFYLKAQVLRQEDQP